MWLGKSIHRHQRIDSTNSEVQRLAESGAPHGTVVVADGQTGGRGRQGRAWHSPAGESLYFSALLRPEFFGFTSGALPPLSLAAAVGVYEGISSWVGSDLTVKWPNDLLVGKKKLCGILIELSAASDRIRHVVVGVGLNVNTTQFPADLRDRATSILLDTGYAHQLEDILAALLPPLETWLTQSFTLNGTAQVVHAWLSRASSQIGQEISVHSGACVLTGTMMGLTQTGALVLKSSDGTLQEIVSGEIISN